MKAVIYARYSSDSQREESIEGQLRECTEYAERNGITILRSYIDRALSARTADRPEFQNMIKDSEQKLFDVVLSFVTNTLSFMRVGGFIISHAGMMSVVLTLTEMFTGAGSIIVLIFGNIFVMALEGFIVGIQSLRLEFYELFSRYFDGQGVPYAPVSMDAQAAGE